VASLDVSTLAWAATLALIAGLFALDLLFSGRRPHLHYLHMAKTRRDPEARAHAGSLRGHGPDDPSERRL
jgi:hypothetical protein